MRHLRKVKYIMLSRNGVQKLRSGEDLSKKESLPAGGGSSLTHKHCRLRGGDSGITNVHGGRGLALSDLTLSTHGEHVEVHAMATTDGGELEGEFVARAIVSLSGEEALEEGVIREQVHEVVVVAGEAFDEIGVHVLGNGQRSGYTRYTAGGGGFQRASAELQFSIHGGRAVSNVAKVHTDEGRTRGSNTATAIVFEADSEDSSALHCHLGSESEALTYELLSLGVGVTDIGLIDCEDVQRAPLASHSIAQFLTDRAEVACIVKSHNTRFLG